MNTSKNSIKAILFTITFFLFILLISLFKGIYLYDIKIKNTFIKKVYLKIDNKIVLKIYGITVTNDKNYTKQALNLHKTVLTAVKFLNVFQNITVKNLHYGNLQINLIRLQRNKLDFDSNFLKFDAILNPNPLYSFVNFRYLDIPSLHVTLKNILLNIYFKYTDIFIQGKGYLNKNTFNINIHLYKNNILTAHIKTPSLKYSYKQIKTDFKNADIVSKIDLNYLFYDISGHIEKSNVKYGTYAFSAFNTALNLNNKNYLFKIGKLTSPVIQQLKNVRSDNLTLSFTPRNGFLILKAPIISTKYDNYEISSYQNDLIFKNFKNINFISKTVLIKNNNFSVRFNGNLLNILNDYKYLSVNGGEFTSKNVRLTTSSIIGNLIKFYTEKIKGEVFGFDTELSKINIDIKHKKATVQKAVYNNVKAYDIIFKNKKLTLHSNTLFDKNIKEILTKFLDIEIPVTQLSGNNDIVSNILFGKEIKSFTDINTSSSLLKLFDFDLIVPKADINITNDNLRFKTEKAKLYLTKDIKLLFDGKGLIDFHKLNLLMKGKVSFNINKIISLKDYNETALIDFKTEKLKARNSNVYIDFDRKELIINPIKKILKYTSFEPFVKDGILLITFGNTTDITTYLSLKLPLLYKHSNEPVTKNSTPLKRLFLNIVIGKKIKIYNKNVKIDINNTVIDASVNSLDINLYPLENLLNETNSSDFNYTVKMFTNNSNLIYKNHKFLSRTATLTYNKDNINFKSIYKKSSLKGYTKKGYLLLEGKNFSNEEFKAFLPNFDFFSLINLDFVMVKSPDNFYTGKIYINRAIVRELKSLNNVIAFINTVPSLLSFSSPGFSSKGYKIRKGYIDYLLYKKILYIKQAKILGDNLDFYAKGYIDFKKNYIFLKVTANMKMKLKNIPIIGTGLSYLLFGKDGSINIKLIVKGDLDNPKVKEDIGKDILMSPFQLFKRAITLPFNLF